MSAGLRHIDVGPELTRSEWEGDDTHELAHGILFPDHPVERQLFYRDDLHEWYIYDGIAWVSLQAAAMTVHDNTYHSPNFEEEGVAAGLLNAHAGIDDVHHSRYTDTEAGLVAGAAVETHRQTEVHDQDQPPASHGNAAHSPNFEEEGVAAAAIETHRQTEVHDQDQPPQEHGNAAHDPNFAPEIIPGRAVPVGLGAAPCYSLPGVVTTETVPQLFYANHLIYQPILTPVAVTIDGYAFEVVSGFMPGDLARFGIYGCDVNLQPTDLIWESDEHDVSSEGVQTINLPAPYLVLPPGRYLTAVTCNLATILRALRGATPFTNIHPDLGIPLTISRTQVMRPYAALPDPGQPWDLYERVSHFEYPLFLRIREFNPS